MKFAVTGFLFCFLYLEIFLRFSFSYFVSCTWWFSYDLVSLFFLHLFFISVYESAKMCFQRAGNTVRESWLRRLASKLLLSMYICGLDTKKDHIYLKKAAELYISNGKFELASCTMLLWGKWVWKCRYALLISSNAWIS